MNRRQAIKKIALSAGVIVSSVTIMSVLQSCQQRSNLSWTPKFFSPEQGAIISAVAECIIPKGQTPGSDDVDVPQFIDLLYLDIFDHKQGQQFKEGIAQFEQQFKAKNNQSFSQASPQQQQRFVKALYQLNGTDTANIFALVAEVNPPASQQVLHQLYGFLISLRELTIEAYFTSELIAEQYLAYDPIPGHYIGSMPVHENTKVWSL
ncbi:MAG: gluconate 2-dehydrogenase subunit 3 family protein [Colwellia sp.]|nr:gluconate 2-dehydrogenase subunit 3 family protein [Colwellia sp.]